MTKSKTDHGFIGKIIHFSVYHRGIVLIFTGLVAVLGWMSFQSLPIDAVPDVTNTQVQVNTPVDGLAPEEIERNITFPIESAMSGLPSVDQVRSITRFGLSQVTIAFHDGVDIYLARQWISERLQSVIPDLPPNVRPQLAPITTGLGEIYHYALEAKTIAQGEERLAQLMEIRALQDWYVRPRLRTVDGVADVNTTGGFEKQIHIQPDPRALARYGIHFSDIEEALEKVNQNMGGGYVQQTTEQFLVQAVGLFRSVDEIKSVPIRMLENLRAVTVGDVAKVRLGKELRTGAALVNAREAVLGTVLMRSGENSRAVSLRVKERLEEISKGLPEGYQIESLYSRSDLVNATLSTVEHNLLTGAILVVLVLLFLVGNIRAALITAVTIPLSLLMTFIIMKWQGISGNLMSLGALDFGIIVDGAVIVLDNCVRMVHDKTKELRRSLKPEELKRAVYEAAIEIRMAAGFGELIIVVVFLPILALVGIEGKMFRPMAATFSFAVISALILSFTTAPALASLVLSGKAEDKEPRLMTKIRALYLPFLEKALKWKKQTLMAGAGAVALGGILFLFLGGEFLPQLDEQSLVVQFARPVNISLDQSVVLQEKSERILKEFAEVKDVFSRIGTSEIATDPMGVNLSDTYVTLKPHSEWPKVSFWSRRSKEDLTNAILERLDAELPGQRGLMSQPIQMRFNELLEGTRADVAVKVFGEDMEQLAAVTREIAKVVSGIEGAGDVEIELKGKSPVLKIVPKESTLLNLGVSKREVLETVGIALGGDEIGYLYEGFKRFPILIRLDETLRTDLEAIKNLPVGILSNATIPLSQAADVSFDNTYGSISREQAKRRAAVMINPRGRDTESFVKEAQVAVEQKVKLPAGYYLEWGGNFENLKEARSRLLLLTPVALLLVLLMIYAAFRNIIETALIFACVPLALVGGVLGLILNGLPFSISAGVGFIALSGIAVLNGVVLVNFFNDLRKKGKHGEDLVREGTSIRLRPVLMTALVDIFGFLPMMLSSGVGAEVQKPLASVVIGGIVSSTLLTLIVLPVLYCIFEKKINEYRNEDQNEAI